MLMVCAPVFSNGQGLSTQVVVGQEQGLKHDSWIMCDNLISLRKTELSHYVSQLPIPKMTELNRALRNALEV